jgi:CheY-like chemotaxis protein
MRSGCLRVSRRGHQADPAHKPDLIFTDLNMPDINGVELAKAVRQVYSKEQLPIIMVTTQNECQDNEAAIKAGVNAILNKPFNERMLREAMQAQMVDRRDNPIR